MHIREGNSSKKDNPVIYLKWGPSKTDNPHSSITRGNYGVALFLKIRQWMATGNTCCDLRFIINCMCITLVLSGTNEVGQSLHNRRQD